MRILPIAFLVAVAAVLGTLAEKAWQLAEVSNRGTKAILQTAEMKTILGQCLERHYTGRRVLPEVRALAIDMSFESYHLDKKGLEKSAVKSQLFVKFQSRIGSLERKLGDWEVSRMTDYLAAFSQENVVSCIKASV